MHYPMEVLSGVFIIYILINKLEMEEAKIKTLISYVL